MIINFLCLVSVVSVFTKKFAPYAKFFYLLMLIHIFTVIIAACVNSKNMSDKSYHVTSGISLNLIFLKEMRKWKACLIPINGHEKKFILIVNRKYRAFK
jgi:hypothetical protein